MKIPQSIKITDHANKTTAFLSPYSDGLKDCYPDTRLNGESTLEFYLPATSKKLQYLTPDCRIYAANRVYSLIKEDAIETVRDGKKLWAKVMAYELQYELDYDFPEPYINNDPSITDPADLTITIVGGGNDLSGGRFSVGSAGHALYAALNGSGWSVGLVDVPGIHDLEMEKTSRFQLIKQIQDVWGGYLVWDSVNKTVSLRDNGTWMPYNGFQIRYAKNLKSITKTQGNKIYTKLYGFGHDDLDFSSVSSNGKKYVTNNSYTLIGLTGIYKNQDIYDANELLEKTTAELALNCKPRYKYTAKALDLRTLPEYSHEEFSLGDMADVIDPAVAPDSPRIRILRHKYHLFKPWDCEFELGDPEERFIEDLKASFTTSDYVSGIVNSAGKISADVLEDLTITANKIVNGAITADKISNLSITSDKIDDLTITADKIANLTITGAQIANGTITADKIQTNQLVVGENIAMGHDATMSWSQITGAPNIPTIPSYITSTKITSTTIESPTISGGQILAGKFLGNGSTSGWITVGDSEATGYGDMTLHRGSEKLNTPVFSVYDEISMISLEANSSNGGSLTSFLRTDGHNTYPQGAWDFSGAIVTGVGNVTAVFG